MLVLLIPLLLAFFALAALVIDLGLVRTTRGRLATATDTASLEALRWRDQAPPGIPAGADPDTARRAAAVAIVAEQFSSAEPTRPFDAGPMFDETHATGSNDVDAGVVITASARGYQPVLQPNRANAPAGDLVAGTYAADTSPADGTSADGTFVAYAPTDFTPDSGTAKPPSLSVLVRLRRTNEVAEDGVSSVGPPLPLLFGRGAAIGGHEPGSSYSVRRDGISVRATSIAAALPAVSAVVGGTAGTVIVQGVEPVALLRSAWENRATLPAAPSQGMPTPVPVTVAGDQLLVGGTVVGYSLASPVTTIGATADAGGAFPAAAVTGYFPIVDDMLVPPRVVGFGWATLDVTAGTLAKRSTAGGAVAPFNASANLRDAWTTLAGLDAATQLAVRQANATLGDPLLAPVSVRVVGD